MKFDWNDVLGSGSSGRVLRGKFDGQEFAVKLIDRRRYSKLFQREVKFLRKSDSDPNVVRYFCTEKHDQHVYIALELCQGNLSGLINGHIQNYDSEQVKLLEEVVAGISHLHHLGVVHRDIKPENVLISRRDQKGCVKAIISDFGLSKNLSAGQSKNSCDAEYSTARDLISRMISHNAADRPSIDEVRAHPFFWTKEKQLEFFCEVSNRIKSEYDKNKKNSSYKNIFQDLETGSEAIFGDGWKNKITNELWQSLTDWNKKIKENSVMDLIHAIRNKKEHYHEQTDSLKTELGSPPDEYMQYFTSRFPDLLIRIYRAASIKDEPIFKKYYG